MRERLEAVRLHLTENPYSKSPIIQSWIAALDQAIAQEALLVEMRESLENVIRLATCSIEGPHYEESVARIKRARAALAKAKEQA